MSSTNLIRWGGLAAIIAGILRGVNSFLPNFIPGVTLEFLYLLTDIFLNDCGQGVHRWRGLFESETEW
jgi:hypothetical protein